ncbi:hypothetical protein [Neorhizobium lilium]|nr:hypothetical protein [Neorhizobium lilium]
MNIPEFLTFLIMPVGLIIFAAIMLYVTRQDRIDAKKKASSR